MARFAHATYASFSNTSSSGGWSVGPTVNADPSDIELIRSAAAISLTPVQEVNEFIGAEEIEALPRRFEYIPGQSHGLYVQSVPAGKDATGRPGNVFTHGVVDHEPLRPLAAQYPIALFRSPDLAAPFRAPVVNSVTLDEGLGEPARGPLPDVEGLWRLICDVQGDRRGVIYKLQKAVEDRSTIPVLLTPSDTQAAFWLYALSTTMTPQAARRGLRVSTFERARSIDAARWVGQAPGFAAAIAGPVEDAELFAANPALTVIDPEKDAGAAPETEWSRMTEELFTSGSAAAGVVDKLVALDDAPGGFGGGLAQLTLEHRRKSMEPELNQLAIDIAEPNEFVGEEYPTLVSKELIDETRLDELRGSVYETLQNWESDGPLLIQYLVDAEAIGAFDHDMLVDGLGSLGALEAPIVDLMVHDDLNLRPDSAVAGLVSLVANKQIEALFTGDDITELMEKLGAESTRRQVPYAGHPGVEKLGAETACYVIGAALASAGYDQLGFPLITADARARKETIRNLVGLANRIASRSAPTQANVEAVARRAWEDFFHTAPDSPQETVLAAQAVGALPAAFAELRIERTDQFLSKVIQTLVQNTRGMANQKGER